MDRMTASGRERFAFLYGEVRTSEAELAGRRRAASFLREARDRASKGLLPLPLEEYVETVIRLHSGERDDPFILAYVGALREAQEGEGK